MARRSRARRLRRSTGSTGDVYHAIADPTRRRLLDHLGRGEQHVNSLAAPFAISRPAVSQHLRILRRAGLVEVRRAGRERRYRLVAVHLREVYDWLGHYEQFWREKLAALGTYLDRAKSDDAPGADPAPKKEKET